MSVLSPTRISRHGYFDGGEVQKLIREYYNGHRTYAVKVWNLMMFQIWWERYFG